MDRKVLKLEDLFYVECGNLTPFERNLRELCFLFINPVIKNFIAHCNYDAFKNYGFNSCRQTAVFTNFILQEILDHHQIFNKNCELIRNDALECYMQDGNFLEDYIHCINVLEYKFKDDLETIRRITIDMSRTICPLLFYVDEYLDCEFTRPDIYYPSVSPYNNVYIASSKVINDYIYDVEYFSKRKGIESAPIMKEIVVNDYINHHIEARYKAYEVYKNFAPLILIR